MRLFFNSHMQPFDSLGLYVFLTILLFVNCKVYMFVPSPLINHNFFYEFSTNRSQVCLYLPSPKKFWVYRTISGKTSRTLTLLSSAPLALLKSCSAFLRHVDLVVAADNKSFQTSGRYIYSV